MGFSWDKPSTGAGFLPAVLLWAFPKTFQGVSSWKELCSSPRNSAADGDFQVCHGETARCPVFDLLSVSSIEIFQNSPDLSKCKFHIPEENLRDVRSILQGCLKNLCSLWSFNSHLVIPGDTRSVVKVGRSEYPETWWGVPYMGVPPDRWMVYFRNFKKHMKVDDEWGSPHFRKNEKTIAWWGWVVAAWCNIIAMGSSRDHLPNTFDIDLSNLGICWHLKNGYVGI